MSEFYLKYVWLPVLFYSVCIVFSEWFFFIYVDVSSVKINISFIIFSISFVFLNIITNIYGYKHARKAILSGVIFSIIFLFYSILVINFPSPSYENNNQIINQILRRDCLLFALYSICFFVSQHINAIIISLLKKQLNGKYFVFRTLISYIVMSVSYSFIVCNMPIKIYTLFGMFTSIVIAISLVVLPTLSVSKLLIAKLQHLEQTDIYDIKTKLNPFCLDVKYCNDDNFFKNSKRV